MTPKQEEVLWRAFISHLQNNVRCCTYILFFILQRNYNYFCILYNAINFIGYVTRCRIYSIEETL